MKRSTFWLVLAAGLVLRIFAWQLLPSVLLDDGLNYHEIVLNLLEKGKYYNSEGLAYRPPLQPVLIFLIYKLFGEKLFLVSFFQILLSLATAVLVWKISKSNLAFAFAALSFDLALFAPLLMAETLALFLLVLGFYFLKTAKVGFAGLSWGMVVLAKPILFPIFLIILFSKENKKMALLLFLLPIFLWCFRNYSVFRKPVFVSTNGGLNFYIGNNPYSKGTYDKNSERALFLFESHSEIEKNSRYFREGLKFIKFHPQETLLNLVRKPFYLLATFGGSAEGILVREGNWFFGVGQLVSYWLILWGAIYYFLSDFSKIDKDILLFIIGYIFSLLPFFTFPRFRIILLPFLAILAGLGMKNFFREPKPGKMGLAGLILCLLTVRDWFKIIRFGLKIILK